jgi:hypothetical protein
MGAQLPGDNLKLLGNPYIWSCQQMMQARFTLQRMQKGEGAAAGTQGGVIGT